MTQALAAIFKIPTESPQLARGAVSCARKARQSRRQPAWLLAGLSASRPVPPPGATGK
jgi:hypothetical protein